MTAAEALRRLRGAEFPGPPVRPERVLARGHRKLRLRRALVVAGSAAVGIVLVLSGLVARALVQEAGPIDTTAPSRPRGLEATAVGPTEVRLSWRASADELGVAGYTVYRDGRNVRTVNGTTTTFTDTDVEPRSTYEYAVDAFDQAGNRSRQSRAVSVTTPGREDRQPPTRPANLQAEALTPTEVRLSWSGSEDNVGVEGYTVYRDGEEVATVEGTTYADTGLEPETEYVYEVEAFDAAGNRSGLSGPARVTTLAVPDQEPPTAPTGLTARISGDCVVQLSWGASANNVGVAGYRVERNGDEIDTVGGGATTFTDPVTRGLFTYTVRALDEAGNLSAPSNDAAVRCAPVD